MGCTGSSPEPAPSPDAPPSVILVLLDTVRADRMGTYGYPLPTTPHLDALEPKVVFEQNQANCSWTRPSMGSILTGHMPRAIGLYEEEFDRLPDDVTLLSERFQAAGFRTIGVTSNPNLNRVFGFVQGFDAYREAGRSFHWMEEKGPKLGKRQPLDDAKMVTDAALELVDATPGDGPLYLQLVYIDPHWPYVQPDEHVAPVQASKQPGYDGGIRYIDAELHRLLGELASRGIHDPWIVITSDHGEGLDSHPDVPNSAAHGSTLYDSVLRVPLIVSHSSVKARRIPDQVENLDVARTTLELLGVDATGFGGQSLAASLRGGEVPPHPHVFAESDFRGHRKTSVRGPQTTVIHNQDAERLASGIHEGQRLKPMVRAQLNQLPPWEAHRRGALETTATRTDVDPDLRAALERFEATEKRPPLGRAATDGETVDGAWVPGGSSGSSPDPKTREALKALGYLEE